MRLKFREGPTRDDDPDAILRESFDKHAMPGSRRQPLPQRKLVAEIPSARYSCELSFDRWRIWDNQPAAKAADSEAEHTFLTKLHAADTATKDASDRAIANNPQRGMSARLAALGRMNARFHGQGDKK